MEPTTEIIRLALLIFLSGTNPPQEFATMEHCAAEQVALAAQEFETICTKIGNTPQEKLEAETAVILQRLADLERKTKKIEAAWAKSDWGWCYGIKHLNISPDDKRHWPYGVRPGRCPTAEELRGDQ